MLIIWNYHKWKNEREYYLKCWSRKAIVRIHALVEFFFSVFFFDFSFFHSVSSIHTWLNFSVCRMSCVQEHYAIWSRWVLCLLLTENIHNCTNWLHASYHHFHWEFPRRKVRNENWVNGIDNLIDRHILVYRLGWGRVEWKRGDHFTHILWIKCEL